MVIIILLDKLPAANCGNSCVCLYVSECMCVCVLVSECVCGGRESVCVSVHKLAMIRAACREHSAPLKTQQLQLAGIKLKM